MLADRKNDGRGGAYRFPAPAMPTDPWPIGQWRPVLPAFANDPAAWIKDVRPFLIREPDPGPPPYPLTSKKYAREFDEVKAIGSLNSSTRTADQTDAARFWAGGPLPWTLVARQLGTAHGLRSIETARMFAMLYTTGADALISVWNGKAQYLFWRPITAIRQADEDKNPATEKDAGWLPLINTPPYPDQPSGLSSVSAAMGEALEHVFGKRERFSVASGSSGTTRSYHSFDQAVDEVVDARVWSGIHFRKADVDGAELGARRRPRLASGATSSATDPPQPRPGRRPAAGPRHTRRMDWRLNGVRVVRAGELDPNTPQTPGMHREAAITTARGGAEKLWAGTVVIDPDAKTGAHHHGRVESVIYVVRGRARMRWGERLEFVAEAGPGDFIYVPPFVPHQEINASPDSELSCVIVRSGQEPVVVNLDLPDVEPEPEHVRWVDDLHG